MGIGKEASDVYRINSAEALSKIKSSVIYFFPSQSCLGFARVDTVEGGIIY